jgi:Ras-related C3 botulinum toxin substrate 1
MLTSQEFQWLDEIEDHAPNIPIVLVGTKVDLRGDADTLLYLRSMRMEPVSYEHASALARKILAQGYVECSSLTEQGVSSVFVEAVR